jgi:uncharacterized protein YkwD
MEMADGAGLPGADPMGSDQAMAPGTAAAPALTEPASPLTGGDNGIGTEPAGAGEGVDAMPGAEAPGLTDGSTPTDATAPVAPAMPSTLPEPGDPDELPETIDDPELMVDPDEPQEGEPDPAEMDPEEPAPIEGDPDDSEIEPTELVDAEALMTDHCAAVAEWDPEWVQWEEEVLLLVNEARAAGGSCGSQGQFDPSEPLALHGALTCAARLHSLDMYDSGYFDHVNLEGISPADRVVEAGYDWTMGGGTGENIAQGQTSPEDVMEAWLGSDGHCGNILEPGYQDIGIGYHPGDTEARFGDKHYWTQNFGMIFEGGGGGGGGGGFGGGGFGN